MKTYKPSHRMRDLVADNPMMLMALSRFDIPLGFGDDTIAEVCERRSVDCPTFLAVASIIGGKENTEESAEVSLPALMSYLKRAHDYFIDFYLPSIRRKLISAISVGEDVAMVILRFYDDYVAEVKRHMEYENEVVFTYVEGLQRGERRQGFSIEDFHSNHGPIDTKLHELKDIFIAHYDGEAANNDLINSVLFDIINCESDLMSHCEVENRVFVPSVEQLERKIAESKKPAKRGVITEPQDPGVHNLTEREKEIIRNIARGLANKEIADRLCLSVHTVATHRRNICAKLNIHSAAGLTVFAIIHKLLDVSEVKAQ